MTQDFFLGQLRLIAVAVIAYFTGTGKLSSADGTLIGAAGAPVLLLFGPWLWSIYSNVNRKLVPKDSVAIARGDVVANGDLKPGDTVSTPKDTAKVVG